VSGEERVAAAIAIMIGEAAAEEMRGHLGMTRKSLVWWYLEITGGKNDSQTGR
jgi:hypothetical protein